MQNRNLSYFFWKKAKAKSNKARNMFLYLNFSDTIRFQIRDNLISHLN